MKIGDKITKNLSYKEVVHSDTAIRKGIPNEPSEEQLENIVVLANQIFQPLRDFFNVPIRINSFFRSFTLNKRIGGSKTSQHCANDGAAMDIRGTNGVSNRQLFEYIRDNLDFDQLIYEFGDDKNPDWVHVSFVQGDNRKSVLRAIRKNGKTIYKNM